MSYLKTATLHRDAVRYTKDGMPILYGDDGNDEPVRYTKSGMPILYEDEGYDDMGDANPHTLTAEILHVCLQSHLRAYKPKLEIYVNMNLYYLPGPVHPRYRSRPYVSPDAMIVKPFKPLKKRQKSYTIGKHGPGPVLTAEILSERSAQQRDVGEKLQIYAMLGVREYAIVDPVGEYSDDLLVLKELQKSGTWKDKIDADGGITSRLGFRLVYEDRGLFVIDAKTGKRYVRPMDAQEELDKAEQELAQKDEELRLAEAKIRALEEKLKQRHKNGQ